MKLLSHQWFLLSIGGILIGFTGMNWNVPIFAWVMLVPFLRYLRLGYSFPKLFFSLILFQILSTLRIVNEPFHLVIALVSGVQGGIVFSSLLWLSNRYRKFSSSSGVSIFFFAFLFTCVEWIGAYFSDLGVWGMMANSQIGNLILLQSVSIFGATGLSFLIYLINVSLEYFLSEKLDQTQITPNTWKILLFSLILLVCFYFFGTFRLSFPIEGKQIKVATITSKTEIQNLSKDPIQNEINTHLIIEKTRLAAKEGAKIVVWNEGAVLVSKEKESEFLKQITSLSKEVQIEIIAAYIIPIESKEFFFDNKLVWIGNDGTIRQTYFKQFIVPGEPVSKNDSEIKVISTDFGNFSVAICYDFDSLRVTNVHSKLGSGITLIPASDWKGINPFHTEMAAMRGIENGSSIVRSTRSGLSGIYDAYGRVKGSSDYFEENDGILVSSLPVTKLNTFYSQWGDWIVWIGWCYLGFVILRVFIFFIKQDKNT